MVFDNERKAQDELRRKRQKAKAMLNKPAKITQDEEVSEALDQYDSIIESTCHNLNDGKQVWLCKDGYLHREWGPAVIYSNGSTAYFLRGVQFASYFEMRIASQPMSIMPADPANKFVMPPQKPTLTHNIEKKEWYLNGVLQQTSFEEAWQNSNQDAKDKNNKKVMETKPSLNPIRSILSLDD